MSSDSLPRLLIFFKTEFHIFSTWKESSYMIVPAVALLKLQELFSYLDVPSMMVLAVYLQAQAQSNWTYGQMFWHFFHTYQQAVHKREHTLLLAADFCIMLTQCPTVMNMVKSSSPRQFSVICQYLGSMDVCAHCKNILKKEQQWQTAEGLDYCDTHLVDAYKCQRGMTPQLSFRIHRWILLWLKTAVLTLGEKH